MPLFYYYSLFMFLLFDGCNFPFFIAILQLCQFVYHLTFCNSLMEIAWLEFLTTDVLVISLYFSIFAVCCLEISSEVQWVRCVSYKTSIVFHCLVSVCSATASSATINFRTQTNIRCLCRNCMGWCCILFAVIHAR